jgi:hypothetical protein
VLSVGVRRRWCPFNAAFTADCPEFPVVTQTFSLFLGLLGFSAFVAFVPLAFMAYRATCVCPCLGRRACASARVP